MWSTQPIDEAPGTLRLALHVDARPATFTEVAEGWRDDRDFRAWFNALLAGVAFSAFRWETPRVTAATAGQPFELALIDSPRLSREPDAEAFAEHFARAESEVVVFPNLGRDAILVVPLPVGPEEAYVHLAAFTRSAPEAQRDALWQAVGRAVIDRLGDEPLWLSTAGAGVAWLHIRLDDSPKYYAFAPYRD
jgi:hypothetical protein